MWDHHELGECWPSQESVVSYLEIGNLELDWFHHVDGMIRFPLLVMVLR
jgi:hypothetical protein